MLRSLTSRRWLRAAASVTVVGAFSLLTGCETNSFLDPGQVGRWQKTPLVVPILDNLNLGVEEDATQFGTARDVQQSDLTETASDYLISPNDSLSVSITDLVAPGSESTKTLRVSQTGKISLPLLPQPVQAAGLSEQQLERSIADAYKDAQVITNAQVTVSVIEARGRTYSVLGAVNGPGLYAIYDADFRLLDALVTARDVTQAVGVDTIYVIRHKKTGENNAAGTTGTGETGTGTTGGTVAPATPASRPAVDPLAPQSNAAPTNVVRRGRMLEDGKAPEGSIVTVDGHEMVVTPPVSATNPATPTTGATAEGNPMGNAPLSTPAGSDNFQFNALKEPSDREVIRIPYSELKNGNLKYNIVILPGDLVFVPQPTTGEYYIGGNVLAPGAYSLTARKITLSQALVAARGFNEVAWPSRTELVRRLPGNKQIMLRIDLDKIFAGQEPDMFLKPDDRVNVGTNAIAPFLGAIRNGFRMTYGFGFLYDRNYAPDNNNNN